MTTELEKEFFDTFGIEPKKVITCFIEEDWLNDYHLKTWYPISDWIKYNAPCKGKKECSDKCNCYQVKNTYPQITDKQYLELINELCNYYKKTSQRPYPMLAMPSLREFKENILSACILHKAYKPFFVKVQAIFKEGN